VNCGLQPKHLKFKQKRCNFLKSTAIISSARSQEFVTGKLTGTCDGAFIRRRPILKPGLKSRGGSARSRMIWPELELEQESFYFFLMSRSTLKN